MDAAIVEFDALPDPVRPPAENDHLLPLARIGFAFRIVEPVALVARVEVRGQRGEFGGAGVDPLVNRAQLEAPAPRRDRLLIKAAQSGQPGVGKPHLLQPQQSGAIAGQPVLPHPLLDFDNLADSFEKPWLVVAGCMDFGGRQAVTIGLSDQQQAVGRGSGQTLP